MNDPDSWLGRSEMVRAARYDRFGGPEVLHVGEMPTPVMRDGDIRIQVEAMTVNGGEAMVIGGAVRVLTGSRFPKAIGTDLAGTVIEAGPSVQDVQVGDRVWGAMPKDQYVRGKYGSASKYVVIPPEQVGEMPESVDFVEAAALIVGSTALIGLRDKAKLGPGERVLVRGGSGGVGTTAVQIAKALGGHVTATVSDGAAELVRSLGADEVVDYRAVPVKDLGRYDVVFDTVGTDLTALQRLTTRKGRMVGIAVDQRSPLTGFAPVLASLIHGSRRIRFFSAAPRRAVLDDMRVLVNAGDLRAVIQATYPLDEIADAHRAARSGGVRGKHVIEVQR